MVGRVVFSDHLEICATWQSVDSFTKNQIEHLLIDERYALNIRDVRSYEAADYDADYSFDMYLILTAINMNKYDIKELRDKGTMERNFTDTYCCVYHLVQYYYMIFPLEAAHSSINAVVRDIMHIDILSSVLENTCI
jgi:hypothetical protein